MFPEIKTLISDFSAQAISEERKSLLRPLIEFIRSKKENNETIRLNFICTHNSRRSHLSQIWAQTMAFHFGIKDIFCYSGGTEATAMFPKVVETLRKQGFQIQTLSQDSNPVYILKYNPNESPIVCFSKEYNDALNPKDKFGAILTCNNADAGCPLVLGAEARFSIKYNDPKVYDHTPQMDVKYAERSTEIGQEMWYVFSNV